MKITVEFDVDLAPDIEPAKVRKVFTQYLRDMEIIEGREASWDEGRGPYWVTDARVIPQKRVMPDLGESDVVCATSTYTDCTVTDTQWFRATGSDLAELESFHNNAEGQREYLLDNCEQLWRQTTLLGSVNCEEVDVELPPDTTDYEGMIEDRRDSFSVYFPEP